MKLYNPSTTTVPDIFNSDKSQPLIAGGGNITLDEEHGKKLLETYGFLIDWTKFPNCPTFRSDDYNEIIRIEDELIKEHERQLVNEQKKKVFNAKGNSNLKIFISFKDEGEDLEIAAEMNRRMRGLGYEVFFFKHSHLPSEKIAEIIPKLKSSNIVIVILSKKVKKSPFVIQEIGIAVSENIPIFPIAIEHLKSFDLGFNRDVIAERYDKHRSYKKILDNFEKVVYKYFLKTKDLENVEKKNESITILVSILVNTMVLIYEYHKGGDSRSGRENINHQFSQLRSQFIEVQSDIKSFFGETSEYTLSIEKIITHITSAIQIHFTIDGGISFNKWTEELNAIQEELTKLRELIIKKEEVTFSNFNDKKRKIKDIIVGWLNGISPEGKLSEFTNISKFHSTMLLQIYYYTTFANKPLEDYRELAEDILDLSEPRTNTDYMNIQNNLGSLLKKAKSLS